MNEKECDIIARSRESFTPAVALEMRGDVMRAVVYANAVVHPRGV